MSERYAFIYEREAHNFGFPDLCHFLQAHGCSLENPVSGFVFLIDRLGEQISTSKQNLEARVESGLDTSFQFWFAFNHDLYCRVRHRGRVRVIEFGLEGTSQKDRETVCRAILKYFSLSTERGVSLGFVFDPDGVSEDYCWDALFIDHELLQVSRFGGLFPELLLVAGELSSNLIGISPKRYEDGVAVYFSDNNEPSYFSANSGLG